MCRITSGGRPSRAVYGKCHRKYTAPPNCFQRSDGWAPTLSPNEGDKGGAPTGKRDPTIAKRRQVWATGGSHPRLAQKKGEPGAPTGMNLWAELGGVRVKRCGKSAPRRQRWRWQGKPHTEQDQIGEDVPAGTACRLGAPQLPGRSLEPRSNARPRGMIALPLRVADRIRLTGPAATFFT